MNEVFLPGCRFIIIDVHAKAINTQMPMAVWLAGMATVAAAAKPVDMPPHLDDAEASTIDPQ